MGISVHGDDARCIGEVVNTPCIRPQRGFIPVHQGSVEDLATCVGGDEEYVAESKDEQLVLDPAPVQGVWHQRLEFGTIAARAREHGDLPMHAARSASSDGGRTRHGSSTAAA